MKVRIYRFRLVVCLFAGALAVALAGMAASQRTSNDFIRAHDSAWALIRKNKPREALPVIHTALSKELTSDERANLLRLAARAHLKLGEIANAIQDIEKAIRTIQHPSLDDIYDHIHLGRLYLALEPPNYAKGIESLRRYISLVKDPHPDAFYYLAQALSRTNRCDEAIPIMQRGIKLTESADVENRRYAHSKDQAARKKKYHELMRYCCSKLKRECAPTKH